MKQNKNAGHLPEEKQTNSNQESTQPKTAQEKKGLSWQSLYLAGAMALTIIAILLKIFGVL